MLTCGQGWTPEGQEKQQPSPRHGPPERRQDPAADLGCGLGEEAATGLPRRPQAQLHLSCSTTEPFPQVRGPSHLHPGPQTQPSLTLSRVQGAQSATTTPGVKCHTSSHLKSTSQCAKPFPSHCPCHLQDPEHLTVGQGLNIQHFIPSSQQL